MKYFWRHFFSLRFPDKKYCIRKQIYATYTSFFGSVHNLRKHDVR